MSENFLLREILMQGLQKDASDIHIQTGYPVSYRVQGQLVRSSHNPSRSEIEEMLSSIMKLDGAIAKLYDKEESDMSYSLPSREGPVRFRVNISLSKEGVYIVLRRLKRVDPEPVKLGVPQKLLDVCNAVPYGLVFIAGVTGSGKSTTLASVISKMALDSPQNIITVEDPIEYEIIPGASNVVQREVGKHTLSFAKGIRAAMRQDPDTILVGEVRDPDTAIAAIQAAKTGHLVFATVHTSESPMVPSRIANMFDVEKRTWITNELMDVMVAAMVQALVPTKEGKRTLATEFLETTVSRVRDLLRENKVMALREIMKTGEYGWTLNAHLHKKVINNLISREMALGYTNDIDEGKQLFA